MELFFFSFWENMISYPWFHFFIQENSLSETVKSLSIQRTFHNSCFFFFLSVCVHTWPSHLDVLPPQTVATKPNANSILMLMVFKQDVHYVGVRILLGALSNMLWFHHVFVPRVLEHHSCACPVKWKPLLKGALTCVVPLEQGSSILILVFLHPWGLVISWWVESSEIRRQKRPKCTM